MSDADQKARAIARRQAGLLTRRQTAAAGLTDDMVRHRIRNGLWTRESHGLYSLYPSDDLARGSWSAHLAVGPHSVVGRRSAASIHGITGFDASPVELLVPPNGRSRRPGVTIVRTSDLTKSDIGSFDGLPVTTIPRTLVDLAAVCDPKFLARVAEDIGVRNPGHLLAAKRTLERVGRRGRPGTEALRRVLNDLIDGEPVAESHLETMLWRIVVAADVGEAHRQHPHPGRLPGRRRTDCAIPSRRMILEADGRAFHQRRVEAAQDRRRDQAAAAAGWLTLRFGVEELRDEAYCVRTVREAALHRAA